MSNLERLISIMAKLRSKDGCPWDIEQNHDSLKENLLEETYEVLDAINSKNKDHMCEELGDLLLQVVFHSQIAKENNDFDIEDVANGICEKLIRRHPHIFGDTKVDNADEVVDNWEQIKKEEKKLKNKEQKTSALDGVIKSMPALMVAQKISKKAVRVGFEWPNFETLKECLYSEIDEFQEEYDVQDQEKMEEELGDILFALVNVARWNKIDAEQALIKANNKFIKRFTTMEKLAQKPLEEYNFQEYDDLWKKAKKELKEKSLKGD